VVGLANAIDSLPQHHRRWRRDVWPRW